MSVPSPAASSAISRRPGGVLIASTLCWLWGTIMVLVGLALLIPAIAAHGLGGSAVVVPAAFLLLAAAYLYGG